MDRTILVVEDEYPLASAIQDKLESQGFGVVCARTVTQAVNYLEEISPIHAIWLDHYLFGQQSGLEFLTLLS